MSVGRIVIVGAGVTGATAAQTLRKDGYDGEVVLIGAEPGLPYRRTMVSKELLTGAATAERAQLKPAQFWADITVELRAGQAVAALDFAARAVTLESGERLGYDAVLLATGGRPRELAAPAGVHHLRTMRDAAALRESLAGAGSLLIVGAGLIGCEVAAAAAHSHATTILEAGDRVMERVLPQEISTMMADLHAAHGVRLETGVALTGVVRGPGGLTATAADGRSWTADVVVVAVGMVPDTELAEAAGLAVAPPELGGGILVDELCATSAPGVFAAGDVARLPNPVLGGDHRVEHWNHAQEHGAAAARAMLGGISGAPVEPYADVPWCWTSQYGHNVQITGWLGAAQEWAVDGSVADHDFTARATCGGELVGAVALGRPKELRAVRAQISARIPASMGIRV